MVLPKAENKEQDFDGILHRGVPFGNDKTSKTCPMDDSTEKRVPDKDDASSSTLDHNRKCFANASNSSNSSNSGVDSYNADCSGGSDDQSSDDTSGKKNLKNAILINVGSVRNSGKYSGSAGSSCSSNGGNSEAASKLCSKTHDRSSFWNEATELEKNAFPSSNETNASFPQKSGPLSNIDPIDPRIDLSIVNSIPSSAFLLPLHATARSALLQCNASPSKESDRKNIRSSILSSDGYHHLLEAVRPFFQAQGITSADQYEPKRAESTTKNSSSEGFTSFFTTTDDSRKLTTHLSNRTTTKDNSACLDQSSSDDNSSMAVLTSPKRRHNVSNQQRETEPTFFSSDSQKKDKSHEYRRPALSHMVTDVSSSNPSNTTSGSGSGDNGANTTGSGTGSNNGSSGSGNENGKGSSEELAKEDSNSGDGTNISDGSATPNDVKHRHINTYRGNQDNSEMAEETSVLSLENQHTCMSIEMDDKINAASNTREQKLLDKKRKRIVMRREYEAQQQASTASSESSSDATECFIQPGQPVTLDEVLVFSKIPRIVVQGIPPYIIVHKNAACCRLTEIDAHLVVGKPISTLLSVPISTKPNEDAKAYDNVDNANIYEANRKNKNTLNKLIATSGLGKIHCVFLHTRQTEHMVGQDLTIKHNKNYSKQQNEDSNDTSLSSNSDRKKPPYLTEQDSPAIMCQISVAPIVASTLNFEKHESTKRIKNIHRVPDLHNSCFEQAEITHFVIQIAPWNSSLENYHAYSIDNLSSKSVDQNLHISNKSGILEETGDSNGGGSVSVQSSDLEAVVAIG